MKQIKLTNGIKTTFDELTSPDSNGVPCVMTLLREKLLNPEDVPEELLYFTDKSGMSVLDVCVERFREPVRNENNEIVPRVFVLTHGTKCKLPLYFRKIKTILAITDDDGEIVANNIIFRGYLPSSIITEEILKLKDQNECTVAYYAAKWNALPKWAKRRKDILLLGNGRGDYVVHVLARRGKLPSEIMTEEILKLTSWNGCAVAYYAAAWNSFPEWAKKRKDILLLGNGQGDYVAHVLASRGDLSMESMTPDILHLENKNGITVFSTIVFGKHLSPEILMLPWNKKIRIFKYLSSAEFLNQNLSEQTIKYVKEQLAAFEALVWKKSFSTLSVIDHNHEDMER